MACWRCIVDLIMWLELAKQSELSKYSEQLGWIQELSTVLAARDPGSPKLRMGAWNPHTMRFVSVIRHPFIILWQAEPVSIGFSGSIERCAITFRCFYYQHAQLQVRVPIQPRGMVNWHPVMQPFKAHKNGRSTYINSKVSCLYTDFSRTASDTELVSWVTGWPKGVLKRLGLCCLYGEITWKKKLLNKDCHLPARYTGMSDIKHSLLV